MPDGTDLVRLRQTLTGLFDDGELRTLCFDLGIDYQSLPGEGKADKARELVAYCDRLGRIAELEEQVRQLRSNAPKAIHDNLPHQLYFFGREAELARIKDALDPEAAGWGVLIDGAGGIGKTALAIRAGCLTPADVFPIKIFLSAKTRELTPRGEQPLADFELPNYMVLLAELARELGEDEIAKMNPNERANELRRALADRHALIIIDNLETLGEPERERLFQFLRRLPRSCKAMVTSRRRTDVAAEIIRLDRLTPEAARQLIAKIAERNLVLARASEAERQQLYETAGGNPLLIEWLAGQLGREGSRCRTVADAVAFMQAAPPGNDPLEYIFGDLLDTFTESEILVLAALAHFTQPAKVKWIAEMTNLPLYAAQTASEDLTDRALLVSDAQAHSFIMSPLSASFLQRKRPEAVFQTGNRLTDRVLTLVLENGWYKYDRFPVLDAEWSAIDAAWPLFLQGDNIYLQQFCDALHKFLDFTGRWDERIVMNLQGEERAVAADDFEHAGWRAYNAGMAYFRRGQALEVLACAQRSEMYLARTNPRARAYAFRLYGLGHALKRDYPAAIAALQEGIAIRRAFGREGAQLLYSLAEVERLSGNYVAAELDYIKALQIVTKVDNQRGVATCTLGLALLALDCQDWSTAESKAREALPFHEAIGHREVIARAYQVLAKALTRQGRAKEGLPYAQRAVEIFIMLRHRGIAEAQAVLKECEEAASDGLQPSE